MKRLEGKTALVTGAGRGLGRAFAERLASLGCNIAVHGMREHGPSEYGGRETLSDVARSIAEVHRVRTVKVLADLTRSADVERVVATASRDLGAIDILVHNAGGDIAAAGRHLLSVVHSITDQQPPAPTGQLNLSACASEAMQLVQPRAEERTIHVQLIGAEQALLAIGEPRGVVQILVNLLNNAIRHSPEGSTVAVIAEHRGDMVAVTVADEGPGIAKEDQDRVFERFWRADPGRVRSRGGTGLGLAIVASLVQAHGGSVAVDSELGRGTKFTVRLPIAPATMEAD